MGLKGRFKFKIFEADLNLKGSVFHSLEAATENAWSPLCFNYKRGLVNSNFSVD